MKKVFSIAVLLIAVFAYAKCPEDRSLYQYEDNYSEMKTESKLEGVHNWVKMRHSYGYADDFYGRCGGDHIDVNITIEKKFDKKMILPLYVYSPSLWQEVIDASADTGDIISIVNPDNGAGYEIEELYEDVVPELINNGKLPIGYLATQWTYRDIQDVKDEIDRWIELYPDIKGFFLDEVSNGAFNYYKEITDYIKSKNINYFLALNPGTTPDNEYFLLADLIVVFEGDIKDYESDSCDFNPRKSAVIVYNATQTQMLDLFENSNCRYIYSTDSNNANPYDTLSSYFDDELNLLR
jgi:hypothetical protein